MATGDKTIIASKAYADTKLPLVGGSLTGALNEAKATVASSATTSDIWTGGNLIDFTGVATVTDFPTAPQAGAERTLICAGACSFTAGANMLIDGVLSGATVTCAVGDTVIVRAISTTQFKLTRLNSTWVSQNLAPLGSISFKPYVSDIVVDGTSEYMRCGVMETNTTGFAAYLAECGKSVGIAAVSAIRAGNSGVHATNGSAFSYASTINGKVNLYKNGFNYTNVLTSTSLNTLATTNTLVNSQIEYVKADGTIGTATAYASSNTLSNGNSVLMVASAAAPIVFKNYTRMGTTGGPTVNTEAFVTSNGHYFLHDHTSRNVYRSIDDGLTWSIVLNTGASYFTDVLYLPVENRYVAAGQDVLYTSSNGVSWSSSIPAGFGTSRNSFHYCNGRCSLTSNGNEKPLVSTDGGVTWALDTTAPHMFHYTLRPVASMNTYAVGAPSYFISSSYPQAGVFKTTDGKFYTCNRTTAELLSWRIKKMPNGTYVAIPAEGFYGILHSIDGETFTVYGMPTTVNPSGVTYMGGYYYISSTTSGSGIVRTADFITFTTVYTALGIEAIGSNGTTLCALKSGVSTTTLYSTNGTTWTASGTLVATAYNYFKLAVANGYFCTGNTTESKIYYSADGITWASSATTGTFIGVEATEDNTKAYAITASTTTMYTSTTGNTWSSVAYPVSLTAPQSIMALSDTEYAVGHNATYVFMSTYPTATVQVSTDFAASTATAYDKGTGVLFVSGAGACTFYRSKTTNVQQNIHYLSTVSPTIYDKTILPYSIKNSLLNIFGAKAAAGVIVTINENGLSCSILGAGVVITKRGAGYFGISPTTNPIFYSLGTDLYKPLPVNKLTIADHTKVSMATSGATFYVIENALYKSISPLSKQLNISLAIVPAGVTCSEDGTKVVAYSSTQMQVSIDGGATFGTAVNLPVVAPTDMQLISNKVIVTYVNDTYISADYLTFYQAVTHLGSIVRHDYDGEKYFITDGLGNQFYTYDFLAFKAVFCQNDGILLSASTSPIFSDGISTYIGTKVEGIGNPKEFTIGDKIAYEKVK